MDYDDEKLVNTIRLFEKQDLYFVYGEDASLLSEYYFKSKSVLSKSCIAGKEVENCSIRRSALDGILRFILSDLLYRVEIWKGLLSSASSNRPVLLVSASPGNIGDLENYLLQSNPSITNIVDSIAETGEILAIEVCIDRQRSANDLLINVCILNESEQVFKVTQVHDDISLLALEYLIVQLGPREIIYSDSSCACSRLPAMLESFKSNCLINECKMSFRKSDPFLSFQSLLGILNEQSQALIQVTGSIAELAIFPIVAICRHINLFEIRDAFLKYNIIPLRETTFVRMDGAAVKALNLIPGPNYKKTKSHAIPTLYEHLNKCKTQQGSRLLRRWILQPLTDVKDIDCRLDTVESFIQNAQTAQTIHSLLSRCFDVEKICRRLQRRSANLEINFKIYRLCKCLVVKIIDELNKINDENSTLKRFHITPLMQSLVPFDEQNYNAMFERIFDFERFNSTGEFLVRCAFSEKLKHLRFQIDEVLSNVQRSFKTVQCELAPKCVKLERSKIHGYHYRLTLRESNCVNKNKKTKYTVLEVRKDGVKFRDADLNHFGPKFENLMQEYNVEQSKIVEELSTHLYPLQANILEIGRILSTIDVLISFAISSVPSQCSIEPYVRPNILPCGSGFIQIIDGRHPCIETLTEPGTYVPNDLVLKKDESYFYVITGPNMGGKSTYMRQSALILLMVHIGCFVPCRSATVSVLDSILARFGSRDYITKGISTFFAEMIEANYVIKTATSDSFVIIDELGRGTSTYDGIGIASSLLEYLSTTIRCFGAFATHFHELAEMSHMDNCGNIDKPLNLPQNNLKHVHMSAKIDKFNGLTMLYKLKPGICEQSFGLHVARLAGLPDDDAENILKELEDQDWNDIFRSNDDNNNKHHEEELMCKKLIMQEIGAEINQEYSLSESVCRRILHKMLESHEYPLVQSYAKKMMGISEE